MKKAGYAIAMKSGGGCRSGPRWGDSTSSTNSTAVKRKQRKKKVRGVGNGLIGLRKVLQQVMGGRGEREPSLGGLI